MGFHIVMKGVMGTAESVRRAGFAETSPMTETFKDPGTPLFHFPEPR